MTLIFMRSGVVCSHDFFSEFFMSHPVNLQLVISACHAKRRDTALCTRWIECFNMYARI